MAEELKFTLKSGMVAAAVAALVVMIFGAMYGFHGRLTVLETNYQHVGPVITSMNNTLYEVRADQVAMKTLLTEHTDKDRRGK